VSKIKQNFLDKVVAFVNPQAGVQRMMAKKALTKFEYDAVKYTRERKGPSNLSGAEDYRSNYDRVELMKRARDLAENNGLVRSLLLKFASHVAANITYQARTESPKANTEIEAYWNEWFDSCDLSTRHTGSTLMQVATMSMLRDGDFLFVLVRDKDGNLKLQGIEADRLGDPYKTYTSLELIGGIHIDRDTGSPTAYDIYNRSIGDFYSYQVTIPASQGFHYFDPLRIDQYRGISAFHTAINDATDIYDIVNFEKLAAKVASSQSAVIKRNNNNASDLTALTTEENFDNQQIKLESMEAGKVSYLEPGEDIIFPDGPSRPSGAFAEFHKILLRNICMGLGIPYSFAVDPSAMSGPTARLEMQQAGRTYKRYQKLLDDKVLKPIKNIVIADAVARGMISGGGKTTTKGFFNFGANVSIDLGRESASAIAEFKAGLRTASDIYSERGMDVEAAFRARAIETKMIQDLAKEYGVPPQAVSEILLPTGQPQGQAQQQTQDGQPMEGQQDLIGQSLNGAQVASLINVINAVAAGALSKDGAISVIVAAFPTISREQAQGIVAGVQQGKMIPTTEKEKQANQDQGNPEEGQGGSAIPVEPKTPQTPTGLAQKKSNLEILQNFSQHDLKMLIAGMMGGIELGKYDGIDFTPPEGAREAAKRALDVREKKPASQKGMTPVGIARARDLMNGVKLSPDTVRRMKAFFDRHEVDKKGETWDEQGKGWQAWNGWGGDAGYAWARKVVGQMESRDKNLEQKHEPIELAEEDEALNPCGMKDDGTFDDKNTCANGYGRPKKVGGYTPKRPGGKIPKQAPKPQPPTTKPAPQPPEIKKGVPLPPLKPGEKMTESQKERARIGNKISNNGKVIVNLPSDTKTNQDIERQYDNLISKGYEIPPPSTIGAKQLSGKYANAYAVAYADYNVKSELTEQSIFYNSKYDNNSEKGLTASIERNVKQNWFTVNDTFAHEYGHILHRRNIPYDEARRNKTRKFGTGRIAQQRLTIAGQVSGYAKENPMEFVAEVFSGHVNGKKYSDSVMEMYKFYKGPELK
jgi:lambda family phage portal protein